MKSIVIALRWVKFFLLEVKTRMKCSLVATYLEIGDNNVLTNWTFKNVFHDAEASRK